MNEFFRCVLESNPFAPSVASEAADAAVHVEAIHHGQFQELVACVEDVRRTGIRQGRVIWGEAGVGKSHLLVQLDRWARREGRAFCPIVRHLDSSAGKEPWNIVKSVLRQMTRDYCANCPLVGTSACPLVQICSCRSSATPPSKNPCQTARVTHGGRAPAQWRQMPLFRLVRAAVEQTLAELPKQPAPYRAGQVLDAFHRRVGHQLQQLNGSAGEAGQICDLLFRFFLAAHRNHEHQDADRAAISAVQWLSGEPLESGQAAPLGIGPPGVRRQTVSLSQVSTAQTVLLALAELAFLSNRTLVLCFDQVDDLAPEQAGSLARFLDPLVDQARNLMVVLSGRQQAMLDLVDRGVIDPATWKHLNPDRSEILLNHISSSQARLALQARLRRFVEPFLTLPKVRRRVEQDPLFPLGSDWFAERIAGVPEIRAREVIHLADERWRQQQAKLVSVGGHAWLAEGAEQGEAAGREEGRGERGDAPTCKFASIQSGAGREKEGRKRLDTPPASPLPSPLSPLPSSLSFYPMFSVMIRKSLAGKGWILD
jgi:hypothetical protein